MRFFWKALLIAIPAGISGYLLYKKSAGPSSGDDREQSIEREENKTSSQSQPEKSTAPKKGRVESKSQTESYTKANDKEREEKKKGKVPDAQIIERLSKLDGVTSRVAKNLVKEGIHTKEELTKLSRDELMEIRGIGPKRADKILNLG